MFGLLVHGTRIDLWILFPIIHIPLCVVATEYFLVKAKFKVVSLLWSAVLTSLVHRNCLREHYGLVDQEALKGSTISHQVVYQAWCRVLSSTPPHTNPARVQPTRGFYYILLICFYLRKSRRRLSTLCSVSWSATLTPEFHHLLYVIHRRLLKKLNLLYLILVCEINSPYLLAKFVMYFLYVAVTGCLGKNKVHGHWFLIYDINSTTLLIPLVLICGADFVRLSQSSPHEYCGSVDQKTRGKHHQPSGRSTGLVLSFELNISIKQ